METLRVGVIGVGSMGQHHARVYYELPNVELAGVADVDEKRAKEIGDRYETEHFKKHSDLLNKVDAVTIATPTKLHADVAIECMKSNVNVLVEKPIAPTMESGNRMIEAADENGVTIMIGHIERFNPAVRELKNITKDENIVQMEARRYGPFTGRINDVGVVLDLMIHDIDVARYILNKKPERLSAKGKKVMGNHEDYAMVTMDMGNCNVFLSANRITQRKIRELWITTNDKFITLDYTTQEINIYREAMPKYFIEDGELNYKQDGITENVTVYRKEPLKVELEHFIDCLRKGKEPEVSGKTGLLNLETALNIIAKLKG